MMSITTVFAMTLLFSLGGPAPPPSVDINSDAAQALLSGLREAGITYSRPDQVVTAAQAVCKLGADGKTDQQIFDNVANTNGGLTKEDATVFVNLARRSYCPPPP